MIPDPQDLDFEQPNDNADEVTDDGMTAEVEAEPVAPDLDPEPEGDGA